MHVCMKECVGGCVRARVFLLVRYNSCTHRNEGFESAAPPSPHCTQKTLQSFLQLHPHLPSTPPSLHGPSPGHGGCAVRPRSISLSQFVCLLKRERGRRGGTRRAGQAPRGVRPSAAHSPQQILLSKRWASEQKEGCSGKARTLSQRRTPGGWLGSGLNWNLAASLRCR